MITTVSALVHLYSFGYMAHDEGYQRFFSYIALFTFSMLMLVMANNFLQLFFGWEAVGLVSYLLIGFWYTRPTAIYANLKAFLVNRVGDFGFLLGIAAIYTAFNRLDFATVFDMAPTLREQVGADEASVRSARGKLEGMLGVMAELQDERERLEAQRGDLMQRRDTARSALSEVRGTRHDLELRTESRRASLDSLRQSLERMDTQLSQLQTRYVNLSEQLAREQKPEELHREEMDRWRQTAAKVAIASVPIVGRTAGRALFSAALPMFSNTPCIIATAAILVSEAIPVNGCAFFFAERGAASDQERN